MSTTRRRQITYIDDSNMNKLKLLKQRWSLSHFLNWALRKHFDDYPLSHCPGTSKDTKSTSQNQVK